MIRRNRIRLNEFNRNRPPIDTGCDKDSPRPKAGFYLIEHLDAFESIQSRIGNLHRSQVRQVVRDDCLVRGEEILLVRFSRPFPFQPDEKRFATSLQVVKRGKKLLDDSRFESTWFEVVVGFDALPGKSFENELVDGAPDQEAYRREISL